MCFLYVQQLTLHLLHIRGLLNYYDITICLEVQGNCESFVLLAIFYDVYFEESKSLFD